MTLQRLLACTDKRCTSSQGRVPHKLDRTLLLQLGVRACFALGHAKAQVLSSGLQSSIAYIQKEESKMSKLDRYACCSG